MNRRSFFTFGTALAAGIAGGCGEERSREGEATFEGAHQPDATWGWVRGQFELSRDWIHMGALLLASSPRLVRDAVATYRRELDQDPVGCLERENEGRTRAVRVAAADYLGAREQEIALTDSTTMGIALVCHGLRLRPGEEVVTTDHEYYATHESLRQAAARTGARVRRVRLFERSACADADEIVERIVAEIGPLTRAVALTWVHSGTGLKLPVSRICDAVGSVNRDRGPEDRVLVCVDGVHGLGVEDMTVADLGCDFLMAGCHKWLFGPRGTGIVWGRREAWQRLRPTIPSFVDGRSWTAWGLNEEPAGPTTAARMTPGGFKAFEHLWAVPEAFVFHRRIGKQAVAARTHALSRQLKDGLRTARGLTLHTPLADELSAGIVCFEMAGKPPQQVVEALARKGIVATTTPYVVRYARLTPSIYNTPDEVERVVRALHELSAAA